MTTVVRELELDEAGQLLHPGPRDSSRKGSANDLESRPYDKLYSYVRTPDAFEPAAMREENRDGTIVVQLLRGMQRNGLLADLHNGQWLTQVLRQQDTGTLPPALRDRINSCLTVLQNRHRIIRHPACQSRPYTDDFRWLHWALETHRLHRDFPFHAVFATKDTSNSPRLMTRSLCRCRKHLTLLVG